LSPARALSFFNAKNSNPIMDNRNEFTFEEDDKMSLLGMVFFGFLSVCALVACWRCGKILIRAINGLFDKIEDKFG
jgi:hypothetical protein